MSLINSNWPNQSPIIESSLQDQWSHPSSPRSAQCLHLPSWITSPQLLTSNIWKLLPIIYIYIYVVYEFYIYIYITIKLNTREIKLFWNEGHGTPITRLNMLCITASWCSEFVRGGFTITCVMDIVIFADAGQGKSYSVSTALSPIGETYH